ncbi:hypothetical protein L3Q72_05375 [Vibrio sp. JC009]|uniref:hypothetical protein n=1 Tax=Vibrio sp. JC009 TaxID=2912314 RepID=UPI0023B189E6|nr:hypothetical protein [Vibrio sp. JC009]WED22824.1 hypothetical protein L3Q72_05375 [Vibrio sp. JC009]
MRLIFFIVSANTVLLAFLYFIENALGWFSAKFISDYFFYAFFIQIAVGAFFSASPPPRLNHMRHSTSKATKVAASMVESDEHHDRKYFSSADLSIGLRFLLSGLTSLLICILL